MSECFGCGKCCYSPKGKPCQYLSKTQKCQIYTTRLGAVCFEEDGVTYTCGTIGDRCTFGKGSRENL